MAGDESNKDKITTLTFVVKKPDGTHSTPRWREVEVQNATCPKCGKTMVVMVGEERYACFPKCDRYYVAD